MSERNKKIGILWLIGPWAGLILILIFFGIVKALLGLGETQTMLISIINVILGLLGLICVAGIIIGIPLGIHYLKKEEKQDVNKKFDQRSGKGKDSVVPLEIKGWNWGAAGLTFIWGAWHRVWISLLMFIPFLGFIWWIVLGIKGNEWAWRKNKWESVEQFKVSQRKWKPWGIVFLILGILGIILNIVNSIQ